MDVDVNQLVDLLGRRIGALTVEGIALQVQLDEALAKVTELEAKVGGGS